jgi:hypothetical protein
MLMFFNSLGGIFSTFSTFLKFGEKRYRMHILYIANGGHALIDLAACGTYKIPHHGQTICS